MIEAIRRFFDTNLASDKDEPCLQSELRLASAALLFEVIKADQTIDEREQSALKQTLISRFQLSEGELTELIDLAEQENEEAVSVYQFTRLINDNYEPQDKIAVIRAMWDVAYADGNIDKYEEAIIRKVSDLLYVSHKDFIRSKHQAEVDFQAG